jgi:hypothetical protein
MTVRQVRLPLLLFVEVLWGFAASALAAQIFSRGDGVGPSIFAVAAVVLGAFGLARGLQQFELDEKQLRLFGVGVTLAALLVILRLEYMRSSAVWDLAWIRYAVGDAGEYTTPIGGVVGGCLALVVLWARGIVRGQLPDEFEAVSFSIFLGLAPVGLAATTQPDVRGFDAFGALALVYVVIALLALALYQSGEADKPVRALAAQWGGGVSAVLVAAVVLAALAAAIDPEAFGFLAPLGEPLRIAARLLAQFVLGPPIAGLVWLIGLILPDGGRPPLQPDLDTGAAERAAEDESEAPLWVRIVRDILVGGVLTAMALVVVAVLALLFRRFALRKKDPLEERTDVEAESSLRDDIGDLLGAFGRRFRRSPRLPASAVAIRRLYGEMLDRAAADGLLRPPAATPLRFAPTLDRQFASDVPSRITDAFTASRYGAREIDDALVRDLRQEWDELLPD